MALRHYRYLILRRLTAVGVLVLFFAAGAWGWQVLKGNLSAAEFLSVVPLADPYHVLQMFAAGAVPAGDTLIGAGIVLAFYALIAGRAFCGWVCPVNMVTDGANWLRNRLGPEDPRPGDSVRMNRHTRYWVMAMGILLAVGLGVAAFEWISPVAMLHRGIVFGMGLGWLAIAAVFAFDLLAVRNGFCGHLCPLGGFYSLAGKYSLLRPLHLKEKCNRCMKCTAVCSEPQVLALVGEHSGPVASGECLNCGRCLEICDEGAMKFGTRWGK
jgi:ferredoxin-type protein NapH